MKNGGIIGPKNNTSVYSAKGLWSLKEQYKNNKNDSWQKQIVTNGLVTWLDAANPSSYPGSGTTWFDISGNSQHFTINGSTSFNSSGYFTFGNNQITDYIIRNNYTIPQNQITISFWFRSNFSSTAQAPITYSVAGNNEMLFYLDNPAQFRPHPKGYGSWVLSTSSMLNKWVNFTWTRDISNGENVIYRNGERLGSYIEAVNNPISIGGNFIIGQEEDGNLAFDPSQNLDGDFSHLLVYNRILSDSEVKTNFYALADRYGLRAQPEFSATGGTMSYANGYMTHTFLSSGVFTTNIPNNIEYFIVAGGGGGGGGWQGGGGGAGGLIQSSGTFIPSSYTVTVGLGGAGTRTSGTNQSSSGQNSSIAGIATAIGGGRGASENPTHASDIGGSGGGGTHGGGLTGSAGTAGQGNAGGNGLTASSNNWAGGGGGGFSSAGTSAVSGVAQPAGGAGFSNNWSGISTVYSAGGAGARRGNNLTGATAANNTGNGGGAGSNASNGSGVGGNGGSGIVIIRYQL